MVSVDIFKNNLAETSRKMSLFTPKYHAIFLRTKATAKRGSAERKTSVVILKYWEKSFKRWHKLQNG